MEQLRHLALGAFQPLRDFDVHEPLLVKLLDLSRGSVERIRPDEVDDDFFNRSRGRFFSGLPLALASAGQQVDDRVRPNGEAALEVEPLPTFAADFRDHDRAANQFAERYGSGGAAVAERVAQASQFVGQPSLGWL